MKRVMLASALVTGAAFVLPAMAQNESSPDDDMLDLDNGTGAAVDTTTDDDDVPGLPETGRGL